MIDHGDTEATEPARRSNLGLKPRFMSFFLCVPIRVIRGQIHLTRRKKKANHGLHGSEETAERPPNEPIAPSASSACSAVNVFV